MYSALQVNSSASRPLRPKLDEKWIDDGNSRSYLLAWLMSLKD
jgi:hypothetical protein